MLEAIAVRNIENGIPQQFSLRLPDEILVSGQELSDFLGLRTPEDGIVEMILSAWRFHTSFQTAHEFFYTLPLEHPDKKFRYISELTELDLGKQLELAQTEALRVEEGLGEEDEGTTTLRLPAKLAKHLALLSIANSRTFEDTVRAYLAEGMIMQLALIQGGKVMLKSGYDTGYTAVSMREQAMLVKGWIAEILGMRPTE